ADRGRSALRRAALEGDRGRGRGGGLPRFRPPGPPRPPAVVPPSGDRRAAHPHGAGAGGSGGIARGGRAAGGVTGSNQGPTVSTWVTKYSVSPKQSVGTPLCWS